MGMEMGRGGEGKNLMLAIYFMTYILQEDHTSQSFSKSSMYEPMRAIIIQTTKQGLQFHNALELL